MNEDNLQLTEMQNHSYLRYFIRFVKCFVLLRNVTTGILFTFFSFL